MSVRRVVSLSFVSDARIEMVSVLVDTLGWEDRLVQ
jgi:hypothetical protein